MSDFKFFLIHRDGYQVLGAVRREEDGYVMVKLYHPNAHVYDDGGRRKQFQYMGGLPNDQIQGMIESGEWEIDLANPFGEIAAANAYEEEAVLCD